MFLCLSCFFFFKQKTAYEMRISDWSSDVCSSDLEAAEEHELDEGDAPCRSQLHERRQDRKAHGARQAEHDAPPDVFLWMRHFAGAGGSIVSSPRASVSG